MAPDAVNHTPLPGEPPGIEGFHYRMGVLLEAFPDARFTLEDIVAEGDMVASRGTLQGTHSGPFAGLPPTGKTVEVTYMAMLRLAGGRFVEHWAQVDQLGLLQQLGAIPAPGQAAG
jgi:predicted ester cyclase